MNVSRNKGLQRATLWVFGSCVVLSVAIGAVRNATTLNPLASPKSKFTRTDVEGEYYFGGGRGANCDLNLRRDGSFEFRLTGCLGEYDRNSGPYELKGDMLLLRPRKPNNHKGFEGTEERFYPIKWGGRTYLIADDQMLGFVSKVAEGWKGEDALGFSGSYYLDKKHQTFQSEMPALTGLPDVPSRFKKYLYAPFKTTVLHVETNRFTIDKGSSDGVVAGMKLYSPSRGEYFGWFSVESANPNSSVVKLWYDNHKMPVPGDHLAAVEGV